MRVLKPLIRRPISFIVDKYGHIFDNWLPFYVIFILGLGAVTFSGCRPAPQFDMEIVYKDLAEVKKHAEKYHYREPWDAMYLLVGLSRDTLQYSSKILDENPKLLNQIYDKYPEIMALHYSGYFKSYISIVNPPPPLYVRKLAENKNLTSFLNDAFNSIKNKNEVYVVERAFETKIRHYCPNQCDCIAKKIASLLEPKGFKTLQIHVSGSQGGVKLKERSGLNWDYHVALAIFDGVGFGIFDPLVFQDTRIHSLAEWYGRFSMDTIQLTFIPL